ncbi:hypothetical protein VTN77DRAFT_387 [Rasamsonia byssochlamydoides]|uniref:uncharacterized protein n=1 Tax=Rasamsonia byssochlamydoides TaxID=89139 RepID=UPI003744A550
MMGSHELVCFRAAGKAGDPKDEGARNSKIQQGGRCVGKPCIAASYSPTGCCDKKARVAGSRSHGPTGDASKLVGRRHLGKPLGEHSVLTAEKGKRHGRPDEAVTDVDAFLYQASRPTCRVAYSSVESGEEATRGKATPQWSVVLLEVKVDVGGSWGCMEAIEWVIPLPSSPAAPGCHCSVTPSIRLVGG